MAKAHQWLVATRERITGFFASLDPEPQSVITLEADITPEQFQAIRRQVVATIAYRAGLGTFDQKNDADGAVIDAFGGLKNPNMGMIKFSGHLTENVALDVADLMKRKRSEVHTDVPEVDTPRTVGGL